jgi:hypothetical protein
MSPPSVTPAFIHEVEGKDGTGPGLGHQLLFGESAMRISSDLNTFAAIEPAEMKAVEGGAAVGWNPAAGSNIEKMLRPLQELSSTPIIPILGEFGSTNNTASVA